MNNVTIKKFTSRDELFSAVAKACEDYLSKAINSKDKASFIVPGGTTPAPAFKELSMSNIDWSKVTVAQSDERWVDADHSHSNQRLTKENLLINNAAEASLIPMKNDSVSCAEGEDKCDKAYQQLALPFSVTMLGMGLDGHFASLFPGSKEIKQGLDSSNENLCMAIDATGCEVAGDYPQRMTLTLSAILNSQVIILLITGEDKLKVIEQAGKKNDPLTQPIAALINQSSTPVEIYWAN